MKLNFTTFIILLCFLFAETNKISGQEVEKEKKNSKNFELSFGRSVMFISNSQLTDLKANHAVILPTSSILFFIELRPLKKIRIPFFMNLPTESKQFLVGNQLINEEAATSYGTGVQFKIFEIKINSKSIIEMEMRPLLSFGKDIHDGIWFAPILASRFRIMRTENFVMYIGGSYAAGVNSLGLLYGTGAIF